MESHILINEFPDQAQKIADLKVNDAEFLKMYVNYEEVNALIQHYEEGEINHTTDEHLTELRRKSVHLKDEIYSYLQKN
ncbi:DUF465 domain-containing protein [Chryseobacterium taklimakanense]|uniref:YdcH family protein n=1 Tax=Chryseobacterium taklimakanense TaxID=536441 RepID=UPI000F5E235B|nr:DUF465 domain-containing protein [Chryseobacterium taklimakanense]AZI23119.1 DUF465 domain-containing protein [Chryseobacterium taklimakanense]